MTTTENQTSIHGIQVTTDEHARFEQIRTEMLNSGHGMKSAEHWAAASIGIAAAFDKARACDDAYAAAVEAGRVPITLVRSR